MASLVEVERRKGLGLIFMAREDKLNALNKDMMRELRNAIDTLEADDDVKIIALTGRGKAFSAGIDLRELAESKDPDEAAILFKELSKLFERLLLVRKPLIIGVNGIAYGGGAELLWAGDIVVAVRDARIAWPEAKWGLIPPILSTIGPLLLVPQRAAYLAMTSKTITADEARSMGLVSLVVETESDLIKVIEDIASHILQHSPQAILAIKRMITHAKLNVYTSLGISELERLSRTKEALEAAKSFKAKRSPSYKW